MGKADAVQRSGKAVFSLIHIDRGAWAVAYRGALIPGAILGTFAAAFSYALDLARAAGHERAHFFLRRTG